ncbi:MAG: ABC transporter ATP-binding protein [Sandaracinaceae bacterium]
MSEPILRVQDLEKTFRIGFLRKRVEAVRGVSFEVRPGEIFGVLGPNGAGKTTTIKMLLGLIFPTKGSLSIFGQPRPGPEIMKRLGYLPENPYVYQYLKPHEFLDLCGRLCGIPASARRQRSEAILERVGLAHAVDRPIGRFSKGMTQRIGLAQALLHDPEVLVLDEPMSGLDPIGRKQVRDLIVEERKRGKTILFTSHILSDVELLCDRVAIFHRGKVTAYGALADLLTSEIRRTVVELEGATEAALDALRALGATVTVEEGRRSAALARVVMPGEEGARRVLEVALRHDARVIDVHEQRETLEDLFLRDSGLAKEKEHAGP